MADITSNLLLYYNFDEGGSPFTDEVGGVVCTAQGTSTGGVSGQIIDGYFVPNTAGAFGNMNSTVNITGAGTIAFWINYTSIVGGSSQRVYGMQAANFPRIELPVQANAAGWAMRNAANAQTGTINLNAVITAGSWIHFAFVRDGANLITVYRDGVAQTNTVSFAGTLGMNQIGAGLAVGQMDATIDELRMYDRALTQEDITALVAYDGSSPAGGVPIKSKNRLGISIGISL